MIKIDPRAVTRIREETAKEASEALAATQEADRYEQLMNEARDRAEYHRSLHEAGRFVLHGLGIEP